MLLFLGVKGKNGLGVSSSPLTFNLKTFFTYTQNRWMLNITYSQSVLFVPSTRGLNLGIGRPPLVCLRRETHQVVDHFAITCVGWSPARTPWQATNNPGTSSSFVKCFVYFSKLTSTGRLFSACLQKSRSPDEEKKWIVRVIGSVWRA